MVMPDFVNHGEASTVSAGPASAGPTMRRRRLGADLRQLREQNSLRLEEVADHLGVAPSTLSRIETGKAPTRSNGWSPSRCGARTCCAALSRSSCG